MPGGGSKPGERRGGRKKGTPNRVTLKREAEVAATGVTPLAVMLDNMRTAHGEAKAVYAKLIRRSRVARQVNDATQRCEFCDSPAHVWFNCPKKPAGWKPERLKNSTAAGKDRHGLMATGGAHAGRSERAPLAVGSSPEQEINAKPGAGIKARRAGNRFKRVTRMSSDSSTVMQRFAKP